MKRSILAVGLMFALGFTGLGCGDSGSGSGGAGGATGGTGGGGTGGTGGTGGAGGQYMQVAQLQIGPFNLPAGETTQCITLRLPNDTAIDVTRIESSLAPGSHHLVLYRSAETQESPTPTPCQPFSGILTGIVPIYVAESPNSFLNFPQGVAYQLAAHQMYRLEAHYINTTSGPIMAMGTVRIFTYSMPSQVTDHADLLFYGSSQISIPAGATVTVGPTFHAPHAGTKIFAITTHTHRLGTDANVDLATSATAPIRQLYDNTAWDNPPLKLMDPPLALGTGEGFRYQCTYHNTTAATVAFGESALQEMCFMWAYYYPTYGFDFCLAGVNC
jgi:hypothetical protein